MKKLHFTFSAVIFITAMLISSYINLSANELPKIQNSSIVGTWLSETDSKWKMVFTSTKCYQYYEGALVETNSYLISNTSPQCGKVVPVDNYTSYLKLTDDQSSTNVTCYEINGITSKNLSIRPVNNGKILTFVRQ
jgi:hypothetical protein